MTMMIKKKRKLKKKNVLESKKKKKCLNVHPNCQLVAANFVDEFNVSD